MHGSAIAPLHSQTENKRAINLKKKEYAKQFSIWSYSCSFLLSVQEEPALAYCSCFWRRRCCSRFTLDTLMMWPTGALETLFPHREKYSHWHSSRTGRLFSPHQKVSSLKHPCKQQQEKEAITPPRSGLMFLPSASPTLILLSLGPNPPKPSALYLIKLGCFTQQKCHPSL